MNFHPRTSFFIVLTFETHHDPIGQPYLCTMVLLQLFLSEQKLLINWLKAFRSSISSLKQAQPFSFSCCCCVLEERRCCDKLSSSLEQKLKVLEGEDAFAHCISQQHKTITSHHRRGSRAILQFLRYSYVLVPWHLVLVSTVGKVLSKIPTLWWVERQSVGKGMAYLYVY